MPTLSADLESNVRANDLSNVTAIHAALAAEPGIVELRSCANSLFSSLYIQIDGRQTDGQVQKVPAVTIQQIMDQAGVKCCQFLKLDCEGAEHEAVRAMTAETASRIGKISMELHEVAGIDSNATIRRLQDFGFRLHRHGPLYYFRRGGTVQE